MKHGISRRGEPSAEVAEVYSEGVTGDDDIRFRCCHAGLAGRQNVDSGRY
jgi:hypothetical protein